MISTLTAVGAAPGPDASAPYPDAWRGWWSVAVLTVLYAISLTDRDVFTLLIDTIGKSLKTDDFQIALLSGFAFSAFYATFGVLFGWATDRFPRRRLILSGVLIWSSATAACGLANNFFQLAFARFGVGAGEAALNPAAYSIIADTIPRRRLSMAIAVFATGVMFGELLSKVAGATLIGIIPLHGLVLPLFGLMEPWRAVFLLVGAPGLVLAFLVWTIPEPARRQRLGLKRAVTYADAVDFMIKRRRFYGGFFGGVALIAATNYAFATWIPAFFIRNYHLTIPQTGFLLAAVTIGPQIIGLLIPGYIADRAFERGRTDVHLRFLIAMGAGKAVVIAFALFAGLNLPMTAALVGLGTLFSGVAGMAPAALQLVTPNEFRGQVSATYLFLNTFFGLGIGPAIAGALTTYAFHDPAKIGWAVAITFIVLQPIALLALFGALKAARDIASEAETWKSA